MIPKPVDPNPPQNTPVLTHTKPRFPAWLKKNLPAPGRYHSVNDCIAQQGLHTVCDEARCPNRAECYSAGTATFLIMGATCTRDCGFCRVAHGKPGALDAAEPGNVALAAKTLGLRHIVITSVTRDDLPLGGARHFAETITVCKELSPHATIEVLIPDFNGSGDALETVLAAAPTILNHNLETVPRLYSKVRPQADVERSLELLSKAHRKNFITKSGIMVGLGETEDEVFRLLTRLKKVGCKIVTIGQYLRPSALQLPIVEFVTPEQFTRYEQKGNELGFLSTLTGPFVRSSYRAGEVFSQA